LTQLDQAFKIIGEGSFLNYGGKVVLLGTGEAMEHIGDSSFNSEAISVESAVIFTKVNTLYTIGAAAFHHFKGGLRLEGSADDGELRSIGAQAFESAGTSLRPDRPDMLSENGISYVKFTGLLQFLVSIDDAAFQNFDGLVKMGPLVPLFPSCKQLVRIGQNAFRGDALNNASYFHCDEADKLEEIGNQAFNDWNGELQLKGYCPSLSVIGDFAFFASASTPGGGSQLVNLQGLNGLTEIGVGAFEGFPRYETTQEIATLTLQGTGEKLISIGQDAFLGAEYVNIEFTSLRALERIDNRAFKSVFGTVRLNNGAKLLTIGEAAFFNLTDPRLAEDPNERGRIDFARMSALTEIGASAFELFNGPVLELKGKASQLVSFGTRAFGFMQTESGDDRTIHFRSLGALQLVDDEAFAGSDLRLTLQGPTPKLQRIGTDAFSNLGTSVCARFKADYQLGAGVDYPLTSCILVHLQEVDSLQDVGDRAFS